MNTKKEVRVRYAPSPTGLQHIGGVRTALFNYLFARSRGGKFILRLEDTDRTRYAKEFEDNIYSTFNWLGFHWDEGPDAGGSTAPYIQSGRLELYKKYALDLLAAGKAYYCFCTPERLETVRKEREASHSPQTGYDRHCREIPAREAAEKAKTSPFVIRLKIPLEGSTTFTDKLLGDVSWKNSDINPDPVLLKSDGFPTYHLANVVDDHLMGITDVLRAQEWLSSTPLHILLYQAFGWEPPEFCHLPMVMGQDGKKLSKRHGATSLDEFRRAGYLSGALINYIALLGASYEEGREFYTLSELEKRFNIEKLNKAPAVFDYQKLQWYNAQYIKNLKDVELAALAMPLAPYIDLRDEKQCTLFIDAMPLVKERAVFVNEIPDKIKYLFVEPPLACVKEFIPKKGTAEDAKKALELLFNIIDELASCGEAEAEARVKVLAESAGIKLGDLLMPLRVAITGTRVSPPLFLSIKLLGADAVKARVRKALDGIK